MCSSLSGSYLLKVPSATSNRVWLILTLVSPFAELYPEALPCSFQSLLIMWLGVQGLRAISFNQFEGNLPDQSVWGESHLQNWTCVSHENTTWQSYQFQVRTQTQLSRCRLWFCSIYPLDSQSRFSRIDYWMVWMVSVSGLRGGVCLVKGVVCLVQRCLPGPITLRAVMKYLRDFDWDLIEKNTLQIYFDDIVWKYAFNITLPWKVIGNFTVGVIILYRLKI